MAAAEADVLTIMDDDLDRWRQEQGGAQEEAEDGQIHMFVADSNGRGLLRAGMEVDTSADILLHRLDGGKRWQTLSILIRRDVNWWQLAATSFGCRVGVAIIWMSGNDVYPHPHRLDRAPLPLDCVELHVRCVLRSLEEQARRVIIIGPVPRWRFDRGLPWEECPAYQLERRLLYITKHAGGDVTLVTAGKALTVAVRRRRIVGDKCEALFASDGIHLSTQGYAAVLRRLPAWLRWRPQ